MDIIKYDVESLVRIECNNWYELDNQLLKACLKNGHSVILNTIYKKIWLKIGYGTTIADLIKEFVDTMPEDDIYQILYNLYKAELINIISSEDEFDVIFN